MTPIPSRMPRSSCHTTRRHGCCRSRRRRRAGSTRGVHMCYSPDGRWASDQPSRHRDTTTITTTIAIIIAIAIVTTNTLRRVEQ